MNITTEEAKTKIDNNRESDGGDQEGKERGLNLERKKQKQAKIQRI